MTETGNTLIAGPSQAPSSIVSNAGIEQHFRSILSWKAPGDSVPNAPERLVILYTFKGKAT